MDISYIEDPLHWHILIAAGLGALIGLERELSGKDPSLRTFSIICTGSCVFTLMSVFCTSGIQGAEPGRISAQIVTGIGFLGAGAIFRSRGGISGLTTAALMWVTAGIGMAVGFNRIDVAVSTTLIAILVTYGLRVIHMGIGYFRGNPANRSEEIDV